MKKVLSMFVLACVAATLHIGAQNLNLRDITSGKYYAKGINPMVSSQDGETYYQPDDKRTMIIRYSYKTGLPVDTVFNAKKARECPFDSFQGFVVAPDDKRILLYTDAEMIYRRSFKATYYYYDTRRNLVRKLSENPNKQSSPVFSRDGRMAAYVIDNNIWLSKFDYDTESQVTNDGAYGKIINGATDWVYEEEFQTTYLMDFSADNTLLAFVRFDESAVPQYSMAVYGQGLYPMNMEFKYPKPGEKNSKVECRVFDIESKTVRTMAIPVANVEYIPRIEFLPEGDELAVMTLNREQNQFNMYYANARSTVARSILRDENKYYIDSEFINSIHFFGNQFTYISEKSGYSHIYLYDNTGVQQKQLTSGDYDVTSLLAVDPDGGVVFYESAEEGPLYRTINRIELKKGQVKKLSTEKGYNTATFSNCGKYYINRYTNASTPSVITMHDATGKQLKMLEDNAALKNTLASLRVPKKEFITVKAADGTELNAYIMKPANFNSSQKYPVIMIQYSGPNSQQVTDRYGMDWTDYATTQGFIVACVDGRGTGARGEEFRKCTYMKLGLLESDDQAAAARYLGTLPYVDKDKIAIWGWSYGGYNVLMSMSRGNGIFKAGVAIAPVTDWKYYDTVYAERFMRTPQQNADGYRMASAMEYARDLQGNLLIIHGSADDNVHVQNTMQYTNALIRAGKQFDMFIMPDRDHSMRGTENRTYVYSKTIDYLKKNM
jgi:dipeptidyl-peptidase-4